MFCRTCITSFMANAMLSGCESTLSVHLLVCVIFLLVRLILLLFIHFLFIQHLITIIMIINISFHLFDFRISFFSLSCFIFPSCWNTCSARYYTIKNGLFWIIPGGYVFVVVVAVAFDYYYLFCFCVVLKMFHIQCICKYSFSVSSK